MKSKLISILTIAITTILLSFANKNEIGICLVSFKNATNLTAEEPDRLPSNSEKVRTVKTDAGEVEITRVDGYRVIYNNEKKAPFVNLKVELSESESFEKDKKNIIDNLQYLNSHSIGMETKELLKIKSNGYEVIGFSRGAIEKESTLGTFVMFPGNGVVVYLYFNNITPEYRNFESVEDYKKQRDRFIDEYTKHLTSCKN